MKFQRCPKPYTFTPAAIALSTPLAVVYTGVQSIIVDAGIGADTYVVSGTATSTVLTINMDSGIDTASVTGDSASAPVVFNAGSSATDSVNVGAAGVTLGGLNSRVTFNGITGQNDILTVTGPVDQNFNISSSTVADSGGHQVLYSNLAAVAVDVGAGGSGNTLTVTSTASGTPVTVNNNSGTDTINVNSTATTGQVIISPSSGNDPVNVDTPGTGSAVAEFIASPANRIAHHR